MHKLLSIKFVAVHTYSNNSYLLYTIFSIIKLSMEHSGISQLYYKFVPRSCKNINFNVL